MRLLVTQHDIDTGRPQSSKNCAIAVAFTRATGIECMVGHDEIWVQGKAITGYLDQVGNNFISLFDGFKEMCRPTVVGIHFPDGCSEPALLRDYVPEVKVAEVVTQKVIPSRNTTPVYAKC